MLERWGGAGRQSSLCDWRGLCVSKSWLAFLKKINNKNQFGDVQHLVASPKSTTSVPAICFRFEPRLTFGYFPWTDLTSLMQRESQAAPTMLLVPAPSLALILRWPHEESAQGIDPACWAVTRIFVWRRWGQLLFLAAAQVYAKIQRSATCPVFHTGLQSFQNGGFWKK